MASTGKMLQQYFTLFLVFIVTVISVLGSEQFIVTHAPKYLNYLPDGGKIQLSEIPDVIKSTYGFSLDRDLTWSGMESGSLFHRPKANVIFTVAGLGESSKITLSHIVSYPTEVDDDDVNTENIGNIILSSTDKSPLIVDFTRKTIFDVQAEHPGIFGKISPTVEEMGKEMAADSSILKQYNMGTLNASEGSDSVLLTELYLVHQMIEALKQNPTLVQDNTPDFFHFRFGGLKEMIIRYGASSQQVTDAVQLIQSFIQKMTDEIKDLYKDNVVIQVVTLPTTELPKLVRKTRSLMQDDDTPSFADQINLADPVDAEFAAAFNIIFWMSLAMALTVLGVSICLWNMDPGRDSIIYRMTSQRMKKD